MYQAEIKAAYHAVLVIHVPMNMGILSNNIKIYVVLDVLWPLLI